MKINLKEVQLEIRFGKFETTDISESIANAIHQNTSDIGVDEIARAIYNTGACEIPEHLINAVLASIGNAKTITVACKQAAIELITKQNTEA
jgi:hypothetical protein